ARALLSNVRPGSYRRGGSVHLRVWLAERVAEAGGAHNLAGAPWLVYYARALGADVGTGVDLHSMPPVTGLLTLGHRCAVEPEVDLCGHWLDGDAFHVGEIVIGDDATVGARTTLLPGAVVGQNADVAPGAGVVDKIKSGQYWTGSPAAKSGRVKHPWPDHRPARRSRWVAAYGLTSVVLSILPLVAAASGLAVIAAAVRHTRSLRQAVLPALLWTPAATLAALTVYALLTVLAVRALSIGLREGYHPVRSRTGWQLWTTERLLDVARTHLFPLYAGLLTPVWLRLLGAQVGRGTEISTALLIPKFTTIDDGAFLADDTMVACYQLGGGWIHAAETTVGRRAFLGNSSIAQPGRRVPDEALIAALSAAPPKAKRASSWLGSPPMRLRRRAVEAHPATTYDPPRKLKAMRAAVETLRLLPVMVTAGIALGVLGALQALARIFGLWVAALCGGLVLLAAAAVAAGVTVAAKWLAVGRIKAGEFPLWSSFVWRNELADTFVETVAAPWFARPASGTPALNLWLRALGARVGRGVWCESYWLPEADLVTLGDGCSVNRGCVVQTHLFHDRIMRMDGVVLEPGSTLGPHCVALPGARLGAAATIGPASLVLRGDRVPASTRWQGNPIRPWRVGRRKARGKKQPRRGARDTAA
ncbi:MAG: amino acid adenylation protein, partial [Mycobacterium sp.]|nr:amino acid adenylation protein [Mycobacterium sp.]